MIPAAELLPSCSASGVRFTETYLGQMFGFYRAGTPAGFIGAIILLLLYPLIVKPRAG